MIDPKKLLPMVLSSFPKASPAQVLEALEKLSQAHPELDNMQALAALQFWLKEKQKPSVKGFLCKGGMI